MAEAVGLLASVVQLINATTKTYRSVKHFKLKMGYLNVRANNRPRH